MRATLEQLKAMSDDEIMSFWLQGNFPFDGAAGCGHCMTQHASLKCGADSHQGLVVAVRPLRGTGSSARPCITSYREELYALRLFYDSLYPQTVEAAEEKTIAELAPSLVAQG